MIYAIFTAFVAIILAYYCGFKKDNYYLITSFLLLTIFLSLGYYWGNDVGRYEERFLYYTSSGISPFNFREYDYVARSEFGFVFINMLCKPLGFWGMRALLFAIENTIILYIIIKHVDKRWYWLAVFVYVFNPNFWVLSSSMMRQWLAICLCLLSADFLSRRKLIWFVVLVMLASTIHQTAFVCFLLLPLYYLSKKYSTGMAFTFVVFLLLFFLFSNYFRDYVVFWINMEDFYTSYDNVTSDVGITAVGRMALFILLLYIAIKQKYREVFFYWVVML